MTLGTPLNVGVGSESARYWLWSLFGRRKPSVAISDLGRKRTPALTVHLLRFEREEFDAQHPSAQPVDLDALLRAEAVSARRRPTAISR